jgi:hypothetical protein
MTYSRALRIIVQFGTFLCLSQTAPAELISRAQRFSQRDPLIANTDVRQRETPNEYEYARCAPTGVLDPAGLCSVRWRRVELAWILRWMSHSGLDVDTNGDGIPDFYVDYGGDSTWSLCCRENGRYDKAGPVLSSTGGATTTEPWHNYPSCLCECLDARLPNQYGGCCNYMLLGTPPYSNSNGALHAAITACESSCGAQLDRPPWVNDWTLPGWKNIPSPYNGPPCP